MSVAQAYLEEHKEVIRADALAMAADLNRDGPAMFDGGPMFQRLLNALSNGDSGQVIATDFGVSRERVRQWKNTFGRVVTIYQVHPEVQRLFDETTGGKQLDEPGPIDLDISF